MNETLLDFWRTAISMGKLNFKLNLAILRYFLQVKWTVLSLTDIVWIFCQNLTKLTSYLWSLTNLICLKTRSNLTKLTRLFVMITYLSKNPLKIWPNSTSVCAKSQLTSRGASTLNILGNIDGQAENVKHLPNILILLCVRLYTGLCIIGYLHCTTALFSCLCISGGVGFYFLSQQVNSVFPHHWKRRQTIPEEGGGGEKGQRGGGGKLQHLCALWTWPALIKKESPV